MKTCPACQRVYQDDTLIYCLDDGSPLTPGARPRDQHETLRVPGPRNTDPPATEVMPAEYRPQGDPSHATWAARKPAVPPTMLAPTPERPSQPQPPSWHPPGYSGTATSAGAKSPAPWIAVSAVLAVLVLGMVGIVGYLVLFSGPAASNTNGPGNGNSNGSVIIGNDNHPYPENDNQDGPVANTNVPGNTNTGDDGEGDDSVQGTWAGTGRQPDGQTWPVTVTVTGTDYAVQYPTLGCRGRWDQVSETDDEATFTEVITEGTNCISGGSVVVYRRDVNQVYCRWLYSGIEGATATLYR